MQEFYISFKVKPSMSKVSRSNNNSIESIVTLLQSDFNKTLIRWDINFNILSVGSSSVTKYL